MWDNDDKNNYIIGSKNGTGQICNDSFANEITKYSIRK